MSPEDFETLAKWIIYNNRLLNAIIIRLYGSDSDTVFKECMKDVEREFKRAKRKGRKK